MSAIARYYNHGGYIVSGYDKTPSPLTEALQAEGIKIHFEERCDLIPENVEETLVIYTPAIPSDMKELVYVKEKKYRLVKRSSALGEIARDKECLAISGTHGKTTISTMLAHIMKASGEGCTAFLGGISKNYNSNLILGNNDLIVAEADEFDRSFLQLFPSIAVITSIDADHLDIYKDLAHLREAFKDFARQAGKAVIIKKGLENLLTEAGIDAKVYTYSFNGGGDFFASDIVLKENGRLEFSLNLCGQKINGCTVGIPGRVNVENAVAASAAAFLHGTPPSAIKESIASFKGVKRRFDIRFECGDRIYIDDYAHHPEELKSTLKSIREIFPGKKICAVFQPHLYTRTRDFQDEFAEVLSIPDSLILLPIYPARELPIPGITSETILKKVNSENKRIVEKKDLLKEIAESNEEIIITFGAGDIDRFVPKIEELLKEKYA